jgi:hypothetical protein
MLPWLLLGAGLAGLVLAVRVDGPGARGVAQGVSVLLVAAGGILLLRRPASSLHLPGWGPRQWRQP